jgi:hypothetical protein
MRVLQCVLHYVSVKIIKTQNKLLQISSRNLIYLPLKCYSFYIGPAIFMLRFP